MTHSMRSLIQIVESAGTLQGDLNALIRDAKAMNIKLRLAFDPKIIDLDFIGRESGAEKGSGAIIMKKLCDIADRYKARINLYADGADPKLTAYYERFGFAVDPRGGDEARMRRLPSRKIPRIVERASQAVTEGLAQYIEQGRIPPDLTGLAAEARKAGSFDNFKKDFILQIKHGTYWHWTDNPNFQIDPTTGPRDVMNTFQVDVGKLMVTSDLNAWDEYSDDGNGRPYVALIDMSDVPRDSYYQTRRGAPNEFFVDDPSKARVIAVMPAKKAKQIDRKRRALLPQSRHELEAFYDLVVNWGAR